MYETSPSQWLNWRDTPYERNISLSAKGYAFIGIQNTGLLDFSWTHGIYNVYGEWRGVFVLGKRERESIHVIYTDIHIHPTDTMTSTGRDRNMIYIYI